MTDEKMNVYQKLIKARKSISDMGLKMSGLNSYSNYKYYDLADFLPQVTKIFSDLGLIAIVTYSKEKATMTIYNCDDGNDKVSFDSPIPDFYEVKGQQPIQTQGAFETYSRRYLYLTALDLVEHEQTDNLDNKDLFSGKEKKEPEAKEPAKNPSGEPSDSQKLIDLMKGLDTASTAKFIDWCLEKFHVAPTALAEPRSVKYALAYLQAAIAKSQKGKPLTIAGEPVKAGSETIKEKVDDDLPF